MRALPFKIPSIEELGLPEPVIRLAEEERGVVLVTGSTGSGKCTTLAAMVEHVNRTMELARSFASMAEQLGAQRRSLEDLALHDPLTHLLNRRAFDERAHAGLGRAEREGIPVALLSLDLDHFKEVNDSHGHAVGDEALRALASAMTRSTRPSDVCGRLGGDEFSVVLPGADAGAALAVASRVTPPSARHSTACPCP